MTTKGTRLDPSTLEPGTVLTEQVVILQSATTSTTADVTALVVHHGYRLGNWFSIWYEYMLEGIAIINGASVPVRAYLPIANAPFYWQEWGD